MMSDTATITYMKEVVILIVTRQHGSYAQAVGVQTTQVVQKKYKNKNT